MKPINTDAVLCDWKQWVAVLCITIFGVSAWAQTSPGGVGQANGQPDHRAASERNPGGSLSPVQDGWHMWTVDAVENLPHWCCTRWPETGVTESACRLEDGRSSYGAATGNSTMSTDEIRVYAQIQNGKTKRVRAFGEQCKVTSDEPVIDHGRQDTAASLNWLSDQLGADRHLTGQTLGVIAAHDSGRAQSLLVESTRPDRPLTTRKDAVFWMGQVRAEQSEAELTRLMRKDAEAVVREHVVFSISQSSLPNKIALIGEAAGQDDSPTVRGQAWFWMAQTGEAGVEKRIRDGMRRETDKRVLDQAIFALSQLPSESGVSALINVVEDARIERELRKRALFWLAQSSSDRAVNYIAEVLNR